MVALSDVPISSSSWLIGAIALLVLGIKSFQGYRRSRVQLSKYITWFALLICTSLFFFSVPAFLTSDLRTLLKFDLVGEVFFYASMVAQAAIVWFLLLRTRASIYLLTVPTALAGLASWLYAVPRSTMYYHGHDFLIYKDPRLSSLAIAMLIILLFVPVGIYFLRLAPKQTGFKARLNSVIFGVVYIGIGLTNGGFEGVTGLMMTPTSVYGIISFFIILLIGALWPRHNARPAVQIPGAQGAEPAPEAPAQGPMPVAPSQEEPTPQSPPPAEPPAQPSQTPENTGGRVPDDDVIGPPPPGPSAPPQDGQDNLTAPPGQQQ